MGLIPESWKDRWVLAALVVGLLLRVLPIVLFFNEHGCTRDECLYRYLADEIVGGQGYDRYHGRAWLWAPGYPYSVALAMLVGGPGMLRFLQVAISALTVGLTAAVGERVGGRAAARGAAWLIALHPTLIFFSSRLWPETLYIFFIVTATLTLLWSRDSSWKRAVPAGVLLGACVLYRGVATLLPPVFAIAMLWPEPGVSWGDSARQRYKHAIAVVLAAMLVVSPYSLYASQKHGGLIISDGTAGQMAWQGNNTFPPQTFDYGLLSPPGSLRPGRAHCYKKLPLAEWNRCELERAAEFVVAEPVLFLRRIPLRLAQLFNPNSFLTRHLREGRYERISPAVTDVLAGWVVLWSLLVMIPGTVGAWAYSRGAFGAVAVGSGGYHILVVACLAGMTRFRLPLEALWLVFAAMALARPRETWQELTESQWRLAGLLVTLPPLIYLVLRFAWLGFQPELYAA